MNIRGVDASESLYADDRSNGGGSVNLSPRLELNTIINNNQFVWFIVRD